MFLFVATLTSVAQETVSFKDKRLSKNKALPRAIFASVEGLSEGSLITDIKLYFLEELEHELITTKQKKSKTEKYFKAMILILGFSIYLIDFHLQNEQ